MRVGLGRGYTVAGGAIALHLEAARKSDVREDSLRIDLPAACSVWYVPGR